MSAPRRTALLFTHDSFLDIMFNMVGGLVLLAIMSALASGGIRTKGDLPVVETIEAKDVLLIQFECRNGRVLAYYDEEVQKKFLETFQALDSDEKFRSAMKKWNDEKQGNAAYWCELSEKKIGDRSFLQVAFHPREAPPPDDDAAIRAILERIKSANPTKKIVAHFQVREDSFAAFHRARDVAEAQGVPYSLRFQTGRDDLWYVLFGGGGPGGITIH